MDMESSVSTSFCAHVIYNYNYKSIIIIIIHINHK
jgi:hypothetical protein